MVKLLRLSISKLHGVFDYDVKFNSDVTFIYGVNGCGKTTVLNITESIITGCLFNLFDYDFKCIILEYFKNVSDNKIYKISIYSSDTDNQLLIEYEDERNEIKKLTFEDYNEHYISKLPSSKRTSDIVRIYFNTYPFLRQIRQTFNYVYLSLKRSSYYRYNDIDNRNLIKMQRIRSFPVYNQITDPNMLEIIMLVYDNYSKINEEISKLKDDFRDKVLKNLLKVSDKIEVKNVNLSLLDAPTRLESIKNSYLSTLEQLQILSEEEVKDFAQSVDNLIIEYKYYNNNNKEYSSINPEIIEYKYQEMLKIEKVVDIANEIEQQKRNVYEPIEKFVNTMNKFIYNEIDGKNIVINNGELCFTTNYSENSLSVEKLSSGEKQLLIFFANLFFNVDKNQSGIFVVDEPELSLHLSWQRKFVDAALSINNNLQLIFATHAPEIIGNRHDKMLKLEKHFSAKGDV